MALYAPGVGAGFPEIDYCHEKTLKVIPTFAAAVLGDFTSQLAAASGFNPAGVLHGEQEFIFHGPIPAEGNLISDGGVVIAKGVFEFGDARPP